MHSVQVFLIVMIGFIAAESVHAVGFPLGATKLTTPLYTATVDVADLDNDGDVDIVALSGANGVSASVYRFLNDGAGNFTLASQTPLASLLGTVACPVTNIAYIPEIATADFDNNAFPDLAILSTAVIGQSAIFRLAGTATGFTCAQVITANIGGASSSLATGDVDADGKDDLYWVDASTSASTADKIRGLTWTAQGLTKTRVLANGTKPCSQGPARPDYRNVDIMQVNLPRRGNPASLDIVATAFNWRSVSVWEGKNNASFYPVIHHRNQFCADDPGIVFQHTPRVGTPMAVLSSVYPYDGYFTANINSLISIRESYDVNGNLIGHIGHQFADIEDANDGLLIDWNSDGLKDWLIVGGIYQVGGYLHIVEASNTQFPFLEYRLDGALPSAGTRLASDDFNGDGKPDIVVAGGFLDGLALYLHP